MSTNTSKEPANQETWALVVTTNDEMHVLSYAPPHHKIINKIVGGPNEIVHATGIKPPFCMVVNGDGNLLGLPLNRLAMGLYGTGDRIVGDIAILKDGYYNGEPDIVGLTMEEARMLGEEIIEITDGDVRWAED